jgi:hypothetical protein
MRAGQRATPDDEAAADVRRVLGLIGEQVLRALGEPPGLRGVHVRRLWENHYRANVVVGSDATRSAVAHSYFLVADANGAVVTATPAITRRY